MIDRSALLIVALRMSGRVNQAVLIDDFWNLHTLWEARRDLFKKLGECDERFLEEHKHALLNGFFRLHENHPHGVCEKCPWSRLM